MKAAMNMGMIIRRTTTEPTRRIASPSGRESTIMATPVATSPNTAKTSSTQIISISFSKGACRWQTAANSFGFERSGRMIASEVVVMSGDIDEHISLLHYRLSHGDVHDR